MTDRITDSQLDNAIRRLNEVSKVNYVSNNAYGYSQLSFTVPSAGGISNISLGNTKKELYYQIQFCLDFLQNEKNPSYNKFNCRHRDEFNRFEGTRDCSMVSEITTGKNLQNRYNCRACGQDITEKDFKKSKIPITYETMKKQVARIEKKEVIRN